MDGAHEAWKALLLAVSAEFGVINKTEGTPLTISLVPLVRSCGHREQVTRVPVRPPLLLERLLGTSQPGPGQAVGLEGKAAFSLGLTSVPCCAGRIQACFANESFSLWLNCI